MVIHISFHINGEPEAILVVSKNPEDANFKLSVSIEFIILAAIIEILSQKKSYTASKIVALVGAGWLIYESIMFIIGGNITQIALAIVGIIFAIILLLTLYDKIDIKIPYSWWVVLIIGFIIFTWVTLVSGTIIMVAFILILMAY